MMESSLPHQSLFRFEKFWFCYPWSRDIVHEVWRILICGNARYRVTRRLELLKCSLFRCIREEVGDIFKWLEDIEAAITDLQVREDRKGGLSDGDMIDLRGFLSLHHSLLW